MSKFSKNHFYSVVEQPGRTTEQPPPKKTITLAHATITGLVTIPGSTSTFLGRFLNNNKTRKKINKNKNQHTNNKNKNYRSNNKHNGAKHGRITTTRRKKENNKQRKKHKERRKKKRTIMGIKERRKERKGKRGKKGRKERKKINQEKDA